MRSARITLFAATFAFTALVAGQAAAQADIAGFEAGTDYLALPEAQETSSPAGQVEVAEVFMYSCPHCFTFEPYLRDWSAEKADYVDLVRIPAPFNEWAVLLGRAYYTAEILGTIDEMHEDFFREIHENDNQLATAAALREFFARYGVSSQDFDEVFASEEVTERMRRAYDLVLAYRVEGTPTLVVDGKYLAMGSMAGSIDRWFEIVDALAAHEAGQD